MKTLYINTSSPTTRVALYEELEPIEERSWPSERNESETLQPAVDALLSEQSLNPTNIDQILVCTGPGGFTSARIGVSAGNAWALAMDCPVASVSVFDLYEVQDELIIVAANASEGWIKWPDSEPEWVQLSELECPQTFVFTGILNEEWTAFLSAQGGEFREVAEGLPSLKGLSFSKQLLEPWYYKDANITWSAKISQNNMNT